MSFTWTQTEKERYFTKAAGIIHAAGFDDLLVIERTSFGMQGREMKVYFKPFHRSGNTRRWWEAMRTIENLHEVAGKKNQFGKKEKTLMIRGYMSIEAMEDDVSENQGNHHETEMDAKGQ